jgi:hypothetical protein
MLALYQRLGRKGNPPQLSMPAYASSELNRMVMTRAGDRRASDSQAHVRPLASAVSDSRIRCRLSLRRREIVQRAFGIKEATHAAFENAVGHQAQDDVPESRLEGT